MDQDHLLKYLEKWLDAEIETLKTEIKRVDELAEARNTSIIKATTLARQSMEHRLEGMNEFRKSLDDVTSTFITRKEHEKDIDRINQNVRVLEISKATLEGKATMSSVYVSYIIAGLALLISIIKFITELN